MIKKTSVLAVLVCAVSFTSCVAQPKTIEKPPSYIRDVPVAEYNVGGKGEHVYLSLTESVYFSSRHNQNLKIVRVRIDDDDIGPIVKVKVRADGLAKTTISARVCQVDNLYDEVFIGQGRVCLTVRYIEILVANREAKESVYAFFYNALLHRQNMVTSDFEHKISILKAYWNSKDD